MLSEVPRKRSTVLCAASSTRARRLAAIVRLNGRFPYAPQAQRHFAARPCDADEPGHAAALPRLTAAQRTPTDDDSPPSTRRARTAPASTKPTRLPRPEASSRPPAPKPARSHRLAEEHGRTMTTDFGIVLLSHYSHLRDPDSAANVAAHPHDAPDGERGFKMRRNYVLAAVALTLTAGVLTPANAQNRTEEHRTPSSFAVPCWTASRLPTPRETSRRCNAWRQPNAESSSRTTYRPNSATLLIGSRWQRRRAGPVGQLPTDSTASVPRITTGTGVGVSTTRACRGSETRCSMGYQVLAYAASKCTGVTARMVLTASTRLGCRATTTTTATTDSRSKCLTRPQPGAFGPRPSPGARGCLPQRVRKTH